MVNDLTNTFCDFHASSKSAIKNIVTIIKLIEEENYSAALQISAEKEVLLNDIEVKSKLLLNKSRDLCFLIDRIVPKDLFIRIDDIAPIGQIGQQTARKFHNLQSFWHSQIMFCEHELRNRYYQSDSIQRVKKYSEYFSNGRRVKSACLKFLRNEGVKWMILFKFYNDGFESIHAAKEKIDSFINLVVISYIRS